MKALIAAVLFTLVALLGSCVTQSTVTEEDRVVVHYNHEAWTLVGAVASTVTGDPKDKVAAMAVLAEKYGTPLAGHLKKIYGPPKEPPKPISEEAVKKAIEGSTKSHQIPWWQVAGTTAISVIGLLLGVGSKFARYLPGGGQLWGVAAGTFEAIEGFIAERKKSGDISTVEALTTALSKAHSDPRLRSLVDKILFEAKKKLES